jgi:PEP-CTERM motif
MRLTTLPLATALVMSVAAAAHASPITYEYTGTIRITGGLAGVNVGDPITGLLRYDPLVLDTSASANEGVYPGAALLFTANVGGHFFSSTTAGELRVFNDFINGSAITDTFQPRWDNPTGPGMGGGSFVLLSLVNVLGPFDPPPPPPNSSTPFTSDAIPTTLNVADFVQNPSGFFGPPTQVFIHPGFQNSSNVIESSIDSLRLVTQDTNPTAVPEPATLSLVGMGALACVRRLRRAKTDLTNFA